MRVGYVLWQKPARSETFISSEIQWLVERGLDVEVFYRHASTEPDVEIRGVRYVQITGALDLFFRARRSGRTLLHSHFAYPTATRLTWPVAQSLGIWFTVAAHAIDIFPFSVRRRNRIGGMSRSRCCGGIFVCGEAHERFLLTQGVQGNRLLRKSQSIPVDALLQRWSGDDRPVREVMFVGRFVEKKGLDTFLAVARRLEGKGLHFSIYGYGTLADALREQTDALAHVSLHVGALSYERYLEVLREADVFLLPSRVDAEGDMDGLPTVLLEASLLGVIVVASDLSAIPELVEDGVTGFLRSADDVAGFASVLESLAGRPRGDFASLRTEARKRVLERHAPDRVNQVLMDQWSRLHG